MKRIVLLALCFVICFCTVGCSGIMTPVEKQTAAYDDHQYCLTMNRQITVVTNQLCTHMMLAKDISDEIRESVTISAENSLRIIEESIIEVQTMTPPEQYIENQENTLRMMENANEHMKSYITLLKSDDNTTDYSHISTLLQSDFIALTAEFNVYYK